jgi:uncharacterized DUF497 family protein
VVPASEETIEIDGFTFTWSRGKAATNRRKHGVTFEEAATVFADPLAKVREDLNKAQGSRRAAHAHHGLLCLWTTSARRPR